EVVRNTPVKFMGQHMVMSLFTQIIKNFVDYVCMSHFIFYDLSNQYTLMSIWCFSDPRHITKTTSILRVGLHPEKVHKMFAIDLRHFILRIEGATVFNLVEKFQIFLCVFT